MTSNSNDFNLDPLYVDTRIVKRIGIDSASNSIAVEINQHLILQTIHIDDFSDKTIKSLKKQLAEILKDNKKKQNVISSVITCINRNIEIIKNSQMHSNQNEEDGTNSNEDDLIQPSDAQLLVEVASQPQNTELFFKNQYGKPYVAVRLCSDRHLEIISLESNKYKHYLARLFRENTSGRVPGKDAINNAINILAAKQNLMVKP